MMALGSLRAAWGLIRVFGPLVLALVFLGLWQHSARQVVRVTGERDQLIAVVTEATVPPDKNGKRVQLSITDALSAQRGIIRDRDSKGVALDRVDRATKASAAADLAAKQTRIFAQAANNASLARIAPIIRKLETVAPTGNEAADAAQLEAASRIVWETGK